MRLPIAVLCLLGMPSLLSAPPLAYAAEPAISSAKEWIGVVTLSNADGVIYREGQNLRVLRGAGVLPGDVVSSGSSGPLAITFLDGPALTLSDSSEIQLAGDLDAIQLGLNSGELRIVHDGQMPLVVESPELAVNVDRAIVRMQRQGSETHCELTTGSAALRVGTQGQYSMQAGEVYAGNVRGIGQVANEISWSIQPERVRLASAIQTAPQLQAPPTTNAPAPVPNQPNTTAAAPGTQTNQDLAQIEEEQRRRRARGGNPQLTGSRGATTPAFSGSSSLSLGSFSGSIGAFSSGGLAADAGQQTFQGHLPNSTTPFPGQIHLVTKETSNRFQGVQLNAAEMAELSGNSYYSIGNGAPPTSQVVTDALTASNPIPNTLAIPGLNAHVVKLDQYGAVDPVVDPNGALASNAAITGLVGATPSGPTVVGTAPLLDERAAFNKTATFALGEFRVSVDPSTGGAFIVGARSSDQDRLIEKDINGNDANDVVTPNPDVAFEDVTDPRFLPQSPTVKVPVKNNALNNRATNYSDLSTVRRAAFTTIVADSLYNYSLRTGQTRFVVDGRIIDISGYKRP